MKRTSESGKGERGRWSVRLILPYFSEFPGSDKCNAFYEKVKDLIVKSAVERGITAVLEMKVTFMNASRVSMYGDLLCYRGKKLAEMRRFSDNRDINGLIIKAPRKVKYGYDGGWYEDGESFISYRNCYTAGSEEGLRRSEYGRLIKENVTAKTGKNK